MLKKEPAFRMPAGKEPPGETGRLIVLISYTQGLPDALQQLFNLSGHFR